MFTVGQEVCCKRNEKGVVVEIQESPKSYPVRVKFHNGGYDTYTADGKEYHKSPEPDLTPAQGESKFTVGQKVWCLLYGEGTTVEVIDQDLLKVRFPGGLVVIYTLSGKLYASGKQVLFTYPVKVVPDEGHATKPSIDWAQVKEEYKWLSVDESGDAHVWLGEPKLNGSGYWQIGRFCKMSNYCKVNALLSYSRGTCDWKDSLVERPNGNLANNAI